MFPLPQAQTHEGRHVSLTPLDAHADAAQLWLGSHEPATVESMWRHVSVGPFANALDMQAWLETRMTAADSIAFTVRNAVDHQPIGSISILRITPDHGVAELGYIWYAPAAQRTKANTETVYLLLKYLFQLGYRRVEWKCDAANARSRAAALRLGFQYEGLFRQHMLSKGQNRDTTWFAMLDHEWPAIAAAMEHWLYVDDSVPLAQLRSPVEGEVTRPAPR